MKTVSCAGNVEETGGGRSGITLLITNLAVIPFALLPPQNPTVTQVVPGATTPLLWAIASKDLPGYE